MQASLTRTHATRPFVILGVMCACVFAALQTRCGPYFRELSCGIGVEKLRHLLFLLFRMTALRHPVWQLKLFEKVPGEERARCLECPGEKFIKMAGHTVQSLVSHLPLHPVHKKLYDELVEKKNDPKKQTSLTDHVVVGNNQSPRSCLTCE